MSRKKNSIRNLTVAIICQAIGLVISFISRIIFLKVLGNEYLGLNGLFTNILSILSLAELGIGEAIIFGLYKPLANRDNNKCMMYMQFYRKVYTIVGIVILFAGLAITPFLNVFIKDMPDIGNIPFIYNLFVINSSVSYFFSYKRNLIIADQKKYIATIYRYVFFFLLNTSQIIYLLIKKDFIGFLALQIVYTLIENLAISKKANKMYPYLMKKERIPLDYESKESIIKNTKALLMHKIGGTAVTATDNIILSSFVSVSAVGIYSNYFLITNALNIITSQIYTSITASVGNLVATNDEEKQLNIFNKIDFLCFWIQCFISCCLLSLFNPFITVWLGSNYLFSFEIVLVIVINFYIFGMRKSVITFKEASGLFTMDRWKSIIEGIINLVVSIILVKKIGIIGVFLGTFISSILTCVWIEPYVLYKYGFNKSPIIYFKKYLLNFLIFIIICGFNYILCNIINPSNLLLGFIIKLIISIIIPNIILITIFHKSENYKYFEKTILIIIKKVFCKHKRVKPIENL